MIFVFGSNTAGRHGAGAAKFAVRNHGAVYGEGEGLQGNAYALPTKDKQLRTLSLEQIKKHVEQFRSVALSNPSKSFQVTRVGCGLAGYKDSAIAPMFEGFPRNCYFDSAWKEYLGEGYFYWGHVD